MTACDICGARQILASCGGTDCDQRVCDRCMDRDGVCDDCAGEWRPASEMYVSILVDGLRMVTR